MRIRVEESQYTVIPRNIVCDSRLSLRARGLYALLTAHAPSMVELNELELSQIDASHLDSALRELRAAGLIRWTEGV